MSKDQYFLDLVKATLPAILLRNIPSVDGAASAAVGYAEAILRRAEVQEALAAVEQAKQAPVYTAPSPKPSSTKRGPTGGGA